MNKKGVTNIAAAIMVMIALTLCMIAFFCFLTMGSVKNQISPKVLESIYVKENQIKFLRAQGVELADAVASVENAKISGENKVIIEAKFENNEKNIEIVYEFEIEEPNWMDLLVKEGFTLVEIQNLQSKGKTLEQIFREYKDSLKVYSGDEYYKKLLEEGMNPYVNKLLQLGKTPKEIYDSIHSQ